MSNETIWIIYLIFDFISVLLAGRLFGKAGLITMVCISIVISNIQVLKVIELFSLTTSLGNITYAGIFLTTDLISEIYGKQTAKKTVFLCFFIMIFSSISWQLMLAYTPSNADLFHNSLQSIFTISPRIVTASLIAFIISQNLDVQIFHYLKQKTSDKYLWLRNNLSTLTSQFVDSIVFVFLAFTGIYPLEVLLKILLTTLVFKWIIALFDTPFIYIGKILLTTNRKYNFITTYKT